MSRRQYTWYLEPIGSHSNKVIAGAIGGSFEEHRDRISEKTTVWEDGIKRTAELLECPDAKFVRKMVASRADQEIDFLIFNKVGRDGQIRNVTNVPGVGITRKRNWKVLMAAKVAKLKAAGTA